MPRKTVSKLEFDAQEAYQIKSADSFYLFYQGLFIASSTGQNNRQLFSSCIQPFQSECFESLTPSLIALRDGNKPPVRRFWIERTKKSSKDADLAICLLWLTAFVRRPFLIQVCAANQKQAGIIQRRIQDLLHYNLWLNDFVEPQRNRILSKNGLGELIIESTESKGGAHGETPDLLVLNELVHVSKWEVMQTHMNNADGVPKGVVIISTNAGIIGSMAYSWREGAKKEILNKSGRWRMHLWKKNAPWILDEDYQVARNRDVIGSEFKRLWEGRWMSGAGDAIDEASIEKCFVLEGPQNDREKGWSYIAGLDLGI